MPDIFVKEKESKKEGNHAHMFTSFCENPIDVSFEHQDADERIVLFLRRHFITNLPWILTSIVLIFIPLFFPFLSQIIDFSFFLISDQLVFIIIFFYYLLVFSYVLANFTNWFYNVFLVTQKRVIDIDYSNIVIHNVAITKIIQVEDVNYTQIGFIHSLFNYGNVFVQTAGSELNFEALSVPRPKDATKIIGDLIGKEI